MDVQKKKSFLLAALLLVSLTMGFMITSIAAAPSGKVSVTATRTIDGDPSDWNGTAGGANTYVISEGEGIWNDAAFDDTGNGSYTYPNGTHDNPAINDSAGAPWSMVNGSTVALTHTDKFNGTAWEPNWMKHGGIVDLREFRVTGDDTSLYMMFRIENMGNTQIAVEWNKGPDRQQILGFGKIFIQVYIDQDGATGVGNTSSMYGGNFNFSSDYAWDAVVSIAGDPNDAAHPASDGVVGWPRVTFSNGTVSLINSSAYCQANASIYPAVIEVAVPKSIIGDYRGQNWRFFVVVGGFDEGRWRQVLATEDIGFWQYFRFAGGEGDVIDNGFDPDIIDMAFATAQEDLLGGFTGSSWVELGATGSVGISFNAAGDVVPWVPLLAIPIVLIALVIARKKLKLPKTEHQ